MRSSFVFKVYRGTVNLHTHIFEIDSGCEGMVQTHYKSQRETHERDRACEVCPAICDDKQWWLEPRKSFISILS